MKKPSAGVHYGQTKKIKKEEAIRATLLLSLNPPTCHYIIKPIKAMTQMNQSTENDQQYSNNPNDNSIHRHSIKSSSHKGERIDMTRQHKVIKNCVHRLPQIAFYQAWRGKRQAGIAGNTEQ